MRFPATAIAVMAMAITTPNVAAGMRFDTTPRKARTVNAAGKLLIAGISEDHLDDCGPCRRSPGRHGCRELN